MSEREITIRVSVWNSGCLPTLLTREIEAVQQRVRVAGDGLDPEMAQRYGDYLAQLQACRRAVEQARS